MAVNEIPQHFGHNKGEWFWGCDACNPTTFGLDVKITVSPEPENEEDKSFGGTSKKFLKEYTDKALEFGVSINKTIDDARVDGKVYALLDAAEDFKTAFPGGSKGNWLSPDFVVTWLEKRAELIESEYEDGKR